MSSERSAFTATYKTAEKGTKSANPAPWRIKHTPAGVLNEFCTLFGRFWRMKNKEIKKQTRCCPSGFVSLIVVIYSRKTRQKYNNIQKILTI
jgi:hypothetical protein